MNQTEAREFVQQLLGAESPLSDNLIAGCIEGAVIPDAAGRLPTDDGWQPTYDGWWAAADAALLAESLQGDRLTSVTSEGSTLQVQGRDWQAVATAWRSRSTIGKSAGPRVIEVPGYPPYGPTSDGVRGLQSLDWS